VTNRLLSLGVVAALWMAAGGRATADVPPCEFQYTIAEVLVSGFTCQESDKIFRDFVVPKPEDVPLDSLVHFFTVDNAVGISFIAPPDPGHFPKGVR